MTVYVVIALENGKISQTADSVWNSRAEAQTRRLDLLSDPKYNVRVVKVVEKRIGEV